MYAYPSYLYQYVESEPMRLNRSARLLEHKNDPRRPGELIDGKLSNCRKVPDSRQVLNTIDSYWAGDLVHAIQSRVLREEVRMTDYHVKKESDIGVKNEAESV